MTIQDVRTELGDLLSALAQSYAFIPGAAELPAIVVSLPERVDHAVTSGYWRVELPIVLVTRSASPLDGESTLLDLLTSVVALLKENASGTAYSSLRVVDSTDFYPITVGNVEALSASVNVAVMIPTPT